MSSYESPSSSQYLSLDDIQNNTPFSILNLDPDTPLQSIEPDEDSESSEHHRTRYQARLAAQQRDWLKAQRELETYIAKCKREHRREERLAAAAAAAAANTPPPPPRKIILKFGTKRQTAPKKTILKLVTKRQREAAAEMDIDNDDSDDGTEYDVQDFQTPPPRKINLITDYQRRLGLSWVPKKVKEESVRSVSVVRAPPKKVIWKCYRSSKFRPGVVMVPVDEADL